MQVLDSMGSVVAIPVTNGLSIIADDAPDRNGWGDEVLGEVLRETLAARWNLSLLDVRNETLSICLPAVVDIGLRRGANLSTKH